MRFKTDLNTIFQPWCVKVFLLGEDFGIPATKKDVCVAALGGDNSNTKGNDVDDIVAKAKRSAILVQKYREKRTCVRDRGVFRDEQNQEPFVNPFSHILDFYEQRKR